MPLASLLSDAGHPPFASEEVAAALIGRGGCGGGRLRASAAAFLDTDSVAKELEGLGGEGKSTVLGQVQLPKRGLLDDLGGSCKLNLGRKMINSADETLSAKDQGEDVAKAAQCAQSGGDVVLDGLFGQALGSNASKEATGVELKGSTEVPLGSLSRKQLHAAQDACHDFATVLLHRMGRPTGHEVKHAETSLSPDDAAHVLRSYGRCLMSMGEASSAAGCRLGQLKREGADETSRMCEESLGPNPETCSMM